MKSCSRLSHILEIQPQRRRSSRDLRKEHYVSLDQLEYTLSAPVGLLCSLNQDQICMRLLTGQDFQLTLRGTKLTF